MRTCNRREKPGRESRDKPKFAGSSKTAAVQGPKSAEWRGAKCGLSAPSVSRLICGKRQRRIVDIEPSTVGRIFHTRLEIGLEGGIMCRSCRVRRNRA